MKRLICLLAIVTFFSIPKLIVAQMITKSIKDFGAKGDGKTNDHEAFIKASKFINDRGGNIKLVIPFGTYIVGKQFESKTYFLEGANVLSLENVNNVQIVGQLKNSKKPLIKYKDGLYFGTFYNSGNKKGQPKCTPQYNNFNKSEAAFIGATFCFVRSKAMNVSNIEIDGNQNGMKIGGYYGDKGRQLNHRGFYIISSNNTVISNIKVHHMALDGIEIASSTNTNIVSIISEYNGRQGLSWVDGDSLIISNSKFNYTGCSRISSAPGAGMDIEPENRKEINYGRFTNCEFSNNRGCGVINDRNSNIANNLIFSNCNFIGYYNWAIWVMGKNVDFNNCNIYGQVAHAVLEKDVKIKSEFTEFNNCNFSNVILNKFTKKQSGFLIEMNNSRLILNNCKIIVQNIGVLYHNGIKIDGVPASEMNNCTIYCDNIENSQIATEVFSAKNNNFNWVEKVSTNLNLIENNNNKFNSLPRNKIKAMIDKKDQGMYPFFDNILNYNCSEQK